MEADYVCEICGYFKECDCIFEMKNLLRLMVTLTD